jgi:hypothetical protein
MSPLCTLPAAMQIFSMMSKMLCHDDDSCKMCSLLPQQASQKFARDDQMRTADKKTVDDVTQHASQLARFSHSPVWSTVTRTLHCLRHYSQHLWELPWHCWLPAPLACACTSCTPCTLCLVAKLQMPITNSTANMF